MVPPLWTVTDITNITLNNNNSCAHWWFSAIIEMRHRTACAEYIPKSETIFQNAWHPSSSNVVSYFTLLSLLYMVGCICLCILFINSKRRESHFHNNIRQYYWLYIRILWLLFHLSLLLLFSPWMRSYNQLNSTLATSS